MRPNQLILSAGALALWASAGHADVSTETHDLNRDGVVTFEEMIEYHPASVERTQAALERHRRIFDGADTNGDGVVDQSENQGGGTGKPKSKDTEKS